MVIFLFIIPIICYYFELAMTDRNELNAIIQLLEDPDQEVYDVVGTFVYERKFFRQRFPRW